MFLGMLFVGRVARARGQSGGGSTSSPAMSPSTSSSTPALPINPVQNGTTFVTCTGYDDKTCLQQGVPYVSTPDCDSKGGVNLPLPVRHTPPPPPPPRRAPTPTAIRAAHAVL